MQIHDQEGTTIIGHVPDPSVLLTKLLQVSGKELDKLAKAQEQFQGPLDPDLFKQLQGVSKIIIETYKDQRTAAKDALELSQVQKKQLFMALLQENPKLLAEVAEEVNNAD